MMISYLSFNNIFSTNEGIVRVLFILSKNSSAQYKRVTCQVLFLNGSRNLWRQKRRCCVLVGRNLFTPALMGSQNRQVHNPITNYLFIHNYYEQSLSTAQWVSEWVRARKYGVYSIQFECEGVTLRLSWSRMTIIRITIARQKLNYNRSSFL